MNDSALTQLADIELPFAPAWFTPSAYLIIAILGVMTSLIFMVWLRRRRATRATTLDSPNTNALLEFDRLRATRAAETPLTRDTAYRIAGVLRVGLRLSELNSIPPLCLTEHHDAWPRIVAALTAARYQPDGHLVLSHDDWRIIRSWLQSTRHD